MVVPLVLEQRAPVVEACVVGFACERWGMSMARAQPCLALPCLPLVQDAAAMWNARY